MQIEEYLNLKQQEIASKLRLLEEEQSKSSEIAPEPMELGTYAWEAEVESTKAAIRLKLIEFGQSLKQTLSAVKAGTYGICDKCKKEIDKQRLEILPTATLCVSCVA